VSDVRDANHGEVPVQLSPGGRRIRVASFVVAVVAAIFGGFVAGTIFALTSTCGIFSHATAGAGKHENGLFAVLAFLVGVAELVLLGTVAWKRRARIRYLLALPIALTVSYGVTLVLMWTALRLIHGPTHCESTGFF
jgi:hypothetical protein